MADINEIIRANTSPRAQYLGILESYVDGTQYDGRPHWFSACDTPLWDRAPCIVYPIVASAIRSFVDLLLGEGRFPVVTPDNEYLTAVHKQCRFRRGVREVFASAMGCGTGVAIFGTRLGKLFLDTTKAKWCTPDLEVDGTVRSLDIRYPYVETYRNPQSGKWEQRVMLYRRTIDAKRDVVYVPVEADPEGREPTWTENAKQTSDHGLGVCPVVWYPLLRGCSQVQEFDGHAIHEYILDEIQAHDFTLSQRHRAALFVGDPQLIEIGVDRGYNPSQAGRTATVPGTPKGGPIQMKEGRLVDAAGRPIATMGGYHSAGPSVQARRKSPGMAWQYESPATKVEYLQIGPDALKAIDENAHDLRQKISEALCVVFMDPENVKFAATVSGKALETLKARQLDRCDQLREDVEEGFLTPANRMLSIIGKKILAEDMAYRWGTYFKADAEEEAKIVTMVSEAYAAGLVTLEKAVEKLAPIFGIEDIEEAVALLEKEQAEKQEQQLSLEHQLSKLATGTASSRGGKSSSAKDSSSS